MACIQRRSETSSRIIVSVGYDSNGKKLTKTKTVRRPAGLTEKGWEKELYRMAAEFESSVLQGTYFTPTNFKLCDFITKWLEEHRENLENKTYYRYEGMLKGRVNQVMGHLKLNQIRPLHLLDFYKNLQEVGIREDMSYVALPAFQDLLKEKNISVQGMAKAANISERTLKGILAGKSTNTARKIMNVLNTHYKLNRKIDKLFTPSSVLKPLSNKTIGHYHRVLSVMFKDAVRWGFMKENPCEKVSPPKAVRNEMSCLDEEGISRLLDALEEEPIRTQTLITLLLITGCRRGEVCGFQWNQVNFVKKLITVKQSIEYTPETGIRSKSPKTEAGNRKIAIPNSTMELLKQYRKHWLQQKLKVGDLWLKAEKERDGESFVDPEWLFTTWDGRPMHPDSVTSLFKKFINKHNLPNIRLHDLRHTSCTMLINAGLNVRSIASRMGHANANVTLTVYAHALKSADREAANILENLTTKKDNSIIHKHENTM